MAIATLAEVKEHLRVTHSNEDVTIQIAMDAAEDFISNFLNQDQIPVNASIKQAQLLIIGDMYDHRESQSEVNLSENRTAFNLLYPYRVDIGI